MRKVTEIHDNSRNRSNENFVPFAEKYVKEMRKPNIVMPVCENPQVYINRSELEKIGVLGRLIDTESGMDVTEEFLATKLEGNFTRFSREYLGENEINEFYDEPLQLLWDKLEITSKSDRSEVRRAIRTNNLPIETLPQLKKDADKKELLKLVSRFMVYSDNVLRYVYNLGECGRCAPCCHRKQSRFVRLCEYEMRSNTQDVALFQTLTYPNQTLPLDVMGKSRGVSQRGMRKYGVLCQRDVQLFIKRMKKYFVSDNCEYKYQSVRYVEKLGYHVYCIGTQMDREDGKKTSKEYYPQEVKIDNVVKKYRLVGEPIANERYQTDLGFVRKKGYDDLKYTIKGIVDANGKPKVFVIGNDVMTSDGSYLLDSIPLYDISKISKFAYAYFGEYGTKSKHPHFHLLYFHYPLRFAPSQFAQSQNLDMVVKYVQPFVNRCWCGDDSAFSSKQCMNNINQGKNVFRGLGATYRLATAEDRKRAMKYGNVSFYEFEGKQYVAFNPVEIAHDASAYVSKYISKGQSNANGKQDTCNRHSNGLGVAFVKSAFENKRVAYDGLHYVKDGKDHVDVVPTTLARSVYPSVSQFVPRDTTKALELLYERTKDLTERFVSDFRLMLHLFTVPNIDIAKVFTEEQMKYVNDVEYRRNIYLTYFMQPGKPLANLFRHRDIIEKAFREQTQYDVTLDDVDLLGDYCDYYSLQSYLLHAFLRLQKDNIEEINNNRQLLDKFRVDGCATRSYYINFTNYDKLLQGDALCVVKRYFAIDEKKSIRNDKDFIKKFLTFDYGYEREYMPLNSVHLSAISQFHTLIRKINTSYIQSGNETKEVRPFRGLTEEQRKDRLTEFGSQVEYLYGDTLHDVEDSQYDSSIDLGKVKHNLLYSEQISYARKYLKRVSEMPVYSQGVFYPQSQTLEDFVTYYKDTTNRKAKCYRKFFSQTNYYGIPLKYIAYIIQSELMTDAKLCYVLGLQPVIFHFKGDGYEPAAIRFHKECKGMSIEGIVEYLESVFETEERVKPPFTYSKTDKDNVLIKSEGEFNPSVRSVVSSHDGLAEYVQVSLDRSANGLRKYPIHMMNDTLKSYRAYRLSTGYANSLDCQSELDYKGICDKAYIELMKKRQTLGKLKSQSESFD